MQSITLVLFAALVTVAYAAGQFYVPRAYYTIDSDGHESIPVPLRRLRRSIAPFPMPYQLGSGSANAEANANSYNGGSASASANANSYGIGGRGNWGIPAANGYGASNPNLLSAGMTREQSGPLIGRSVSASTVVGINPSGYGSYKQTASVNN